MKQLLLVLLGLTLNAFAFADVAEEHQKNCETSEVKELVGDKGSCRIVAVPTSFEKEGFCIGKFAGSLPCVVSYISVKGESMMNLTCGPDLKNPTINQDMSSSATAYSISTIINTSEGKTIIRKDKNNYKLISSPALSLSILESEGRTTGKIDLLLNTGKVSLTDVVCE